MIAFLKNLLAGTPQKRERDVILLDSYALEDEEEQQQDYGCGSGCGGCGCR
jgi:hypothetical protein